MKAAMVEEKLNGRIGKERRKVGGDLGSAGVCATPTIKENKTRTNNKIREPTVAVASCAEGAT